MMTGPPAPDDRQLGNGPPRPATGAGRLGDNPDPLDALRARLAGLWVLVLRRFRDYALCTKECDR